MSDRPNLAKKKIQVEELVGLLKANKNVVVISLKGLPDSILQSTKKKLRNKTVFKVYKGVVIKRAFESINKPIGFIELTEKEPICVVLSNDMSPYELSTYFENNKVDVSAKPGQIAETDIIVPKMETNIAPGPALSELKSAGLKAAVKKGKIAILSDAIVAKSGEKITLVVAKALQKLDIKPYKAGISAMAGIDSDNIVFSKEVLSLDSSVFIGGVSQGFDQGFALSVNSGMPTRSNAEILINKAFAQATALAINQNIWFGPYADGVLSKAFGQAMSVKKYIKIEG